MMKGVNILFALWLSLFISLSSAEWLQFALKTQRELTTQFTVDKAPLVATHNSYSSSLYNVLFTNQNLSITAQLELGVRWLELDLHYIKELVSTPLGPYRICHASSSIYQACQTYGWTSCTTAGLTNYVEDTGCLPTNPNFTAIFQEISIWKNANPEEILVIYFDDVISSDDISRAPNMTTVINAWLNLYFGQTIYTPANLVSDGGAWPTIATLKARRKTLIITTDDHTFGGTYIHADFRGFKYPASNVEYFSGYPICKSTYKDYTGNGKVSFGFFQEDRSVTYFQGIVIVNGTADTGAFSIQSALQTMQCQFTIFVDFFSSSTNFLVWSWDTEQPSGPNKCASMNSEGKWVAEDCGFVSHRFACRSNGDIHAWTVPSKVSFRDANSTTICPAGYSFSTPRTALENLELLTAIKGANIQANVWISMNQYPNGTWSAVPTTYTRDPNAPDPVESDPTPTPNPGTSGSTSTSTSGSGSTSGLTSESGNGSPATRLASSYLFFFFFATCILLVL